MSFLYLFIACLDLGRSAGQRMQSLPQTGTTFLEIKPENAPILQPTDQIHKNVLNFSKCISSFTWKYPKLSEREVNHSLEYEKIVKPRENLHNFDSNGKHQIKAQF